jgi:hypothetical protein
VASGNGLAPSAFTASRRGIAPEMSVPAIGSPAAQRQRETAGSARVASQYPAARSKFIEFTASACSACSNEIPGAPDNCVT